MRVIRQAPVLTRVRCSHRVSSLFQAFEANNLTVKAVSDETLFRIVGLMTSLELLILVAWTVGAPLDRNR